MVLKTVFALLLSVTAHAAVSNGIYNNSDGSPAVPLINEARNTIDMEIYEMDDPKVIQALRDAMNRGVKIRIVKEPQPVGGSCQVFSLSIFPQLPAPKPEGTPCSDQKKFVSEVIGHGGVYVPFKKNLCGANAKGQCVQHGKIIVVDDRIALITSGNFNTTNLCDLDYNPRTCNRDYSYITDDRQVTRTFQNIIEKDIKGESYDVSQMIPKDVAPRITVSPISLAPLVAFIRSAKEKIQIQNQYLKEPNINNALIEMAKRGVHIEVNVASACAFGTPSNSDRRKVTDIFSGFDAAGITSRMFNKRMTINGHDGYLHAKAIVVDGKRAWVGSVNGSTQAVSSNREFGVFFDESNDVKALADQMTQDFNHPMEETWQQSLDCLEGH